MAVSFLSHTHAAHTSTTGIIFFQNVPIMARTVVAAIGVSTVMVTPSIVELTFINIWVSIYSSGNKFTSNIHYVHVAVHQCSYINCYHTIPLEYARFVKLMEWVLAEALKHTTINS